MISRITRRCNGRLAFGEPPPLSAQAVIRMSRESLSRAALGTLGLATVAWYWLPTTDSDELQGLAIAALPFLLLAVFYRKFWTSILVGILLLGALWYSLILIRVDGHSTASLVFLVTLPISYIAVVLGLLIDRDRIGRST